MTDNEDVIKQVISNFRGVIAGAESWMGARQIVDCIADALRNEAGKLDEEGNSVRAAIYMQAAEWLDARRY